MPKEKGKTKEEVGLKLRSGSRSFVTSAMLVALLIFHWLDRE